ncbi:MAG: HAMP domain-containing histidine kinase [Clostridia bacterium]|nr:HAMP domain-containing histidine kinase [Clostridia bacterium]
MIRSTGITRRWLRNSFTIIMLALVLIVFALSLLVRNNYYTSIKQALHQRSAATAEFFYSTSGVTTGSGKDFSAAALAFVESFETRDKMELQIIDQTGTVLVSSTGFETDPQDSVHDFAQAVQSSNGVGSWEGTNSNGEHVIAVSRLFSVEKGARAGALRFVVSLEAADEMVITLTVAMALLALIIMFFVLLSGNYFIRSIVEPVKSITASASQIAKGDFDIRLESDHSDEIGDLVESINSMAAELAAGEKIKNDFISSVSHELRTPLTAIKGWGETLITCPSDEKIVSKGMKVIIGETERLSGLVEELLDFSRLQSGRMKLEFEKIDVLAEVSDVVFFFSKTAEKQKVNLTFFEVDSLPVIYADKGRFRQILVNIIDNAIKYSESGGEVYITTASDNEWVKVLVRDHGCGIAEKDLALIKRRFYKANASKRGFGIGLGVAEELVSLHQGKLLIESEEGVGTLVTILMPVAEKFDLVLAEKSKVSENVNIDAEHQITEKQI